MEQSNINQVRIYYGDRNFIVSTKVPARQFIFTDERNEVLKEEYLAGLASVARVLDAEQRPFKVRPYNSQAKDYAVHNPGDEVLVDSVVGGIVEPRQAITKVLIVNPKIFLDTLASNTKDWQDYLQSQVTIHETQPDFERTRLEIEKVKPNLPYSRIMDIFFDEWKTYHRGFKDAELMIAGTGAGINHTTDAVARVAYQQNLIAYTNGQKAYKDNLSAPPKPSRLEDLLWRENIFSNK